MLGGAGFAPGLRLMTSVPFYCNTRPGLAYILDTFFTFPNVGLRQLTPIMTDALQALLREYWPQFLFVLSAVCAAVAATHAAMNKSDVRAAIAWVGIILMSPLLGALFYLIAGINRIRHGYVSQAHDRLERDYAQVCDDDCRVGAQLSPALQALCRLGDRVSPFPLSQGNHIRMLYGGDAAYAAMLKAINEACQTVALQSYIFDSDAIGQRFVAALAAAQQRGVTVRILIDGVGVRYSRPRITRQLRRAGLRVALFIINLWGLRMPYANLRSHRKILVVDGQIGFTGGLNIRAGFSRELMGECCDLDTHFQFQGPLVRQLLAVFAHDWEFTTGEAIDLDEWCAPDSSPNTVAAAVPLPHVLARGIRSGPDRSILSTHQMLQGALAMATKHIRIQSPYFLPDPVLMGALTTAARRGVQVDIVIPGKNNLRLVQYAMLGQLDLVIQSGCRVWRSTGNFDHSKLLTVDDCWSYVGSSNLDPRSLRLNFEMDVEIYDAALAREIAARIDENIRRAAPLTREALAAQPFPKRLRNRIIWLASPYL